MRSALLVGLAALTLASCAPDFRVIETTDRFQPESRRLDSSSIELRRPRGQDDKVTLRLAYLESPQRPAGAFLLIVSHFGEVWALPEEIKVLVDGTVTTLRPSIPAERSVELGGVWEHLTVEVPEVLFQNLLRASRVELRLEAPDRNIDRKLDDEALARIREFYTEVRRRS